MSNDYYNHGSVPATGSSLSSATMRAEFDAIATGMDKLPPLTGNNNEVVVVNAGATGQSSLPRAALIDTTIVDATDKATPVDADLLPLVDSAASNTLKKLTWANVKATLKTYFDSVTTTLTNKTLTSPVISGGTINGATVGATTPSTGAFTTLSSTGNTTLGDASTDTVTVNGYMGVGGAASSGVAVNIASTALAGTNQLGLGSAITATAAAVNAYGTYTAVGTAAAPFTLTNAYGHYVVNAAKGSGSTITNLHGVYVADQTQGTNNYGITSLVSSGTNKWNVYASGTAANYFAGTTTFNAGVGVGGGASPATGQSVEITYGAVAGTGRVMAYDRTGATRMPMLVDGSIVQLATGGTERIRIDSAGNVGVGVTPSAWSGVSAIQLGGFAAIAGSSAATSVYANAYYDGTNSRYGITGPATHYQQNVGSGQHRWYTAPSGIAGNAISFTQAMTLDASGNLLVSTANYAISNDDNVMIGGSEGIVYVQHANGRVPGSTYISFDYNAGVIGSITQSGTTAVAYSTTSDHRLKENVRPANAGRFMDIEFVDFEWVDGRHDCGVIAHQLQSVYPDLVLGEKDATEVRTVEVTPAVPEVKDEEGNVITEAVPAVTEEQTFPVYQQVNYIGLIGRMGTRIQQLQRTVDAQAEMLSAIEARLAALENTNA